MMRTTGFVAVIAAGTLLALPLARAEDKPYTEGHVWVVTMVKVKYGMMDAYLNEVTPLRTKLEEQARKEGLLLSSHTLAGQPSNREDFDVLFLQEYKNWAAFDGLQAKMDALEEKIIGPQDKQTQILVKRTEVREVLGSKAMQELLPK
jgi:hypothetical protein